MVDGYERQINYARISLTNMCNLRCTYCSQYDGKKSNISLEFYKNLIDALVKVGINKIRFTGGEPLLNPNIVELVKYTKDTGKVSDICITTNGLLLDSHLDDLVKSGLTRINFSLDTTDKNLYKELTGSYEVDKVINNMKLAKERGLTVKINAVLLKGITDVGLHKFMDFGYENDIQIRFIELMPIGSNIDYYNKYFLSSEVIKDILKCESVIKYSSDVSTYYKYKENYEFGIISAITNHFCDRCNRIRITSRGTLRLCLHSDKEIDLLSFKDSSDDLFKVISESILTKPEKHFIDNKDFVKSDMVSIGG